MLTTLLLALTACLLLVALFAASEAALAASNRVRLRHLLRIHAAEDNDTAQLLSSELSGDVQKFIATVTIAANLPLLLAAALALWFAKLRFESEGQVAIFCAGMALATVVFGQIAPRLLVERPGAALRLWWVRPARILVAVLRPFVEILLWIGALILRPIGVTNAPPAVAADGEDDDENEHEVRELVENAHAAGVIEAESRELIESIFTFGDTRAHEVMTPRPDMVSRPVECDAAELLDIMQHSGHSRIPLYEGNIDRVVGIAHVRDVLACLSSGETQFSPRGLMSEPLFVPESQKIEAAFAAMRAGQTHLAIVVDEFGGTAGLLTVEDILEELVGDIADEHDPRVEASFVPVDEFSAFVDARLHTEDLAERWNLELPTGEFDTVGGFVIEQLGRAPLVDEKITVELETETVTLTVRRVKSRRPQRIFIRRQPRAEGLAEK